MKKVTQIICLILILSTLLAIPAFAAEQASDYFMSYSYYLSKVSSTEFRVWFDVTAVRGMDELGASVIKVQRCPVNGTTWETVQTYTREDYPHLIGNNISYKAGYVTYSNATTGYKYRGYVKFYAADEEGSATRTEYTSAITMP